jgi:hypothetical protein
LGAAILAGSYLFFDARPVTGGDKAATDNQWDVFWSAHGKAILRAGLVFIFTVIATVLIGLVVLALPASICQTYTYTIGRLPLLDGCLIGPLGLVHWKNLLAYAPIALLAGMITQFIWEERPVTAPLWASDES